MRGDCSVTPKLMQRHVFFLLAVLLVIPYAGGVLSPRRAYAEPYIREFTLGLSSQGRPITVVQVGSGERKLVVIGDTHGGPEANTYWLALQLIDYFRAFPEAVPPNVRLYLIPTINPDGLALESRFDAAGVDLNRNMNTDLDNCSENDWRTTVFGAYGLVADTGGPFAASQLEGRMIVNFLLNASGAIFLHSSAGMVFPAFCDHTPSIEMAQVYAEAAGYTYMRYWPNYMIYGSMPDWAGSMGIAAITPELLTGTESEFEQNLSGLKAVLNQPERLLPLPADQIENEVLVPAPIWRYWRSHGGEAVFGLPLQPAEVMTYGLVQTFTRARFELRTALADTTFLVQPAPLGQALLSDAASTSFALLSLPDVISSTEHYMSSPVSLEAFSIFFEQTGYSLSAAFLDYWRLNGGIDVFGYPISEEFVARTTDGQMRTVQYFERAVFAYHPEDGSVRLEPLGWQGMLREQMTAPWIALQVR